MRLLYYLIILAIGFAISWFTFQNWTMVTLTLFSVLEIDVPLPLLLISMFLLGLVPYALWAKARYWAMRRKVNKLSKQLEVLLLDKTIPDKNDKNKQINKAPVTQTDQERELKALAEAAGQSGIDQDLTTPRSSS